MLEQERQQINDGFAELQRWIGNLIENTSGRISQLETINKKLTEENVELKANLENQKEAPDLSQK